jgi:DNA-binding response OmpR family regulator
MRGALAAGLRRAGFDVLEFRHGIQLAQYIVGSSLGDADSEVADLLVADARLPGATGIEVLEYLRHFDATTPAILLTATDEPMIHAEAYRLNATVLELEAPFDGRGLVSAAREACVPRKGPILNLVTEALGSGA